MQKNISNIQMYRATAERLGYKMFTVYLGFI